MSPKRFRVSGILLGIYGPQMVPGSTCLRVSYNTDPTRYRDSRDILRRPYYSGYTRTILRKAPLGTPKKGSTVGIHASSPFSTISMESIRK